jgi:hypothetical protein
MMIENIRYLLTSLVMKYCSSLYEAKNQKPVKSASPDVSINRPALGVET